jgi:hypothetical protein
VIAELGCDASGRGAPADHRIVRVADVGREEFEEAHRGAFAGGVDNAGTWPCAVVNGTRIEFMPKAPAERCEITVRAVPHRGSA